MRNFTVPIGSPHEALSVRAKHGKTVEVGVESDPLQAGAVFVDDIKIEIAAVFRVGLIGSKDDAFSIGEEIWPEIGGAVVRDLMLVGTVGVHHPDFEIARTDQALCEQILVVFDLFGRLRMLGAVDDFLTVVRPEGAAIVAKIVGELLHAAAVSVHRVDVQVTVTSGSENDVFTIARNRGLGVVANSVGELPKIGAIGLGGVNLIGIVDRPDITARIVGFRRAIGAGRVCGRKKNFVTRGEKITAGCAALACADELGPCGLTIRSVHGHGIDLIARDAFALVLEDELLVVDGEVRLSVLATEGELPNIFEVPLFLVEENLVRSGLLLLQ